MTQAQDRPGRAAVWMIGAIASFSAMAVAGREVSAQLDTFELMTYRSLVGVIIVSAVLTLTRSWHKVTTDRLGLHLIRNVMHFSGQNLWFFAVTMIPLAQVFALEFTQPIWVLLLSPLLLGERLTPVRGLAAAMGFAGILIVIRPGTSAFQTVSLLPVLTAFIYALLMLSARWVDSRESVWTMLLYLTGTSALLSACVVPFVWQPVRAGDLWLFAAIAVFGTAGMTLMTQAFRLAPAAIVAPFDYTGLIWATAFGWLIWTEVPDATAFVGAAVIIASGVFVIWREGRAGRSPYPDDHPG